jgi:hypothetical protein
VHVTDAPAVLVLIKDAEFRDAVARQLAELDVVPIAVRADRATHAVERFAPIAAVMDEGHASIAPDDFLESACSHHVRLVTLPERLAMQMSDVILRDAVTRR